MFSRVREMYEEGRLGGSCSWINLSEAKGVKILYQTISRIDDDDATVKAGEAGREK